MQTFTLPAGQRLTVTADSTSIGIFWRLSDSVGEEPYAPTALTAGNSGTAGPFNTVTRWAVDSSVGELTYSSAVMTPLPQEGGEMAGNITMASTETVDGRDISADGSALDSVDSIAEILVLLKTVDGTGSGLDADLVDGLEAAALLKVDGSSPITAGSAAGAVAQSFGADATEGYEIKVVDETVSALAAVSTDLTADIPDGAYLISVQANIETLVESSSTSVKVGIGPTTDPDKYGITSGFTKNLKIDTIPAHAILSGAEDVQINMCATGGGIGDTAASAGAVRVRMVYALPNSLADAA